MLLVIASVLAGPPSPDDLGSELAAETSAELKTPCHHDADDQTLRCEGRGVASLSSLMVAYPEATRKQRKGLYKRWLALLVDPSGAFDEALRREALRPMVKSRADFLQLSRQARSLGAERSIPTTPVTPSIHVGLALDAPEAMRIAGAPDLDALGLSWKAGLETAVENLAGLGNPPVELVDGVYIIATGDGYDSARFLADGAFDDFGLKGRPVVLLVSRDLVFVTGDRQFRGIEQLLTLAARTLDDETVVKRVSLIPVIQTDDGWADLTLPELHPGLPVLTWLRRLQTGQWYHDQRAALEGDGGPPIAKLSGVELADGTGRHVVTLTPTMQRVPVADHVAFVRDDTPYLVDWDTFVELAEPPRVEGTWPPLYTVDGAALHEDLTPYEAAWKTLEQALGPPPGE